MMRNWFHGPWGQRVRENHSQLGGPPCCPTAWSGMYNMLRHHLMLVPGAGLLSTPIFLLHLVHCVHLQH